MFVIFHVNVHKACLFCEAQACWSCCKNESQKGAGPWTRRAQTRSSARLFCLGNFFFLPTSSLLLPSINPTARSPHGACPNPLPPETIQHQKKNLLIRRHLLVSALAQRDPQAPDASVGVSQGSDIFAKAALQKSGPVCTPASSSLCPQAAVSVSIFRVRARAIFSWIGKKENT